MKEKIFISACFLGDKVRYDGKHQALANSILSSWGKQNRLVRGCPECLGGLPVPREPAEIQQNSSMIIDVKGNNVTQAFILGAQKTLDICLKENIKYALLKESSPSCGSNSIYDGTFSNNKIKGKGVTAQLLHQHGIKVYSENNIDELFEQID